MYMLYSDLNFFLFFVFSRSIDIEINLVLVITSLVAIAQ